MDLGSSIVGIIILLICIIPFAFISINNNKKTKKLLQGLSAIAERNNCKISNYELWNNSSIGIDNTDSMIFFTSKVLDTETSYQLNLAEIKQCKVINTNRTVSQGNEYFKVVDKLELAFTFYDKNKQDVVFIFYNSEHDSTTLTGELQLVEKWCNLCNEKISEITAS